MLEEHSHGLKIEGSTESPQKDQIEQPESHVNLLIEYQIKLEQRLLEDQKRIIEDQVRIKESQELLNKINLALRTDLFKQYETLSLANKTRNPITLSNMNTQCNSSFLSASQVTAEFNRKSWIFNESIVQTIQASSKRSKKKGTPKKPDNKAERKSKPKQKKAKQILITLKHKATSSKASSKASKATSNALHGSQPNSIQNQNTLPEQMSFGQLRSDQLGTQQCQLNSEREFTFKPSLTQMTGSAVQSEQMQMSIFTPSKYFGPPNVGLEISSGDGERSR